MIEVQKIDFKKRSKVSTCVFPILLCLEKRKISVWLLYLEPYWRYSHTLDSFSSVALVRTKKYNVSLRFGTKLYQTAQESQDWTTNPRVVQ